MRDVRLLIGLAVLLAAGVQSASAQFVNAFENGRLDGWETQTGDGKTTMSLEAQDERAIVTVDATEDRRNIWWAVLRRDVSAALDLERLQKPGTELRVTARIRVSHAPRRVNLSLNTQRTTNFHRHLMEFDIPDTTRWHTIRMTTDGFDGRPGDTINAQLALIDWGLQTYRAAVDSFAVEVVSAEQAGTASDRAVPYPLPVRDPETRAHHVPVAAAGLITREHPDVTLADWHTIKDTAKASTWTVTTDQFLLLRWKKEALPTGPVAGPGVLTLRRHSVHRADTTPEEFGQVRVVEITSGAPDWTDTTVTYRRFTQGRPFHEVLNPQPIVDLEIEGKRGKEVRIPISESVLRRLLWGETKGIALRPLGPVSASFYAGESYVPTLHLNTEGEVP